MISTILLLAYIIIISIALSKIDNKIGSTKYWNWYVIGLLLFMLGFLIPLIILIGAFLIYYSQYAIILEASCIKKEKIKKFKRNFIILIIGGMIFNIISILITSVLIAKPISISFDINTINFILGIIILFINLSIYISIGYVTYLLSKKLEGDNKKIKNILAGLFFFLYIPFLAFYNKVNNLKPCDSKLDNQQNIKQE